MDWSITSSVRPRFLILACLMALALALLYFQDTDPEQESGPASYHGSPLALRVAALGLKCNQTCSVAPGGGVSLAGTTGTLRDPIVSNRSF